MAIRDSSGWKENAVSYVGTTGCSSFKFFFGSYWDGFAESFHFNTNKCPISAGEYIVGYKALMACEKHDDYLIEHNLYFSKKSSNVTEVKGNITFKVDYDDSVKFNARLAIKDSIGGWKDNAVIYSAPTGCTAWKFFLGSYWDNFSDTFHFNTKKCPIPKGVYKSSGFELPAVISTSNFPRKFFYGTYKFRIYYHNSSKKEVGCIIMVVEGEYIVGYKALMACEKHDDYLIEHNLYFSKKSSNVTEVKGNITFKVDYDDSVKFNARLAIKDSIGGWKDNAVIYSAPTGCTAWKFFLGSYWDNFSDTFHFNTKKCPIPKGVYKSSGFELPAVISTSNFPRKFFYGTYKFRIYYHNSSKKEVGCIIIVVEVKRPWE
ncbi:Hypothetical protein CINCED_3A007757 [Cinara cedri]|uniref:Uncharacterized protein n=1 Tax=Cinara cedri TaxID=506608 RepID=A0A5E4NPL6_9HEMI|nr:Hypothetical protein CINCED_3A007757 [Cinara cedri]